jgi:hypothetical protein
MPARRDWSETTEWLGRILGDAVFAGFLEMQERRNR